MGAFHLSFFYPFVVFRRIISLISFFNGKCIIVVSVLGEVVLSVELRHRFQYFEYCLIFCFLFVYVQVLRDGLDSG